MDDSEKFNLQPNVLNATLFFFFVISGKDNLLLIVNNLVNMINGCGGKNCINIINRQEPLILINMMQIINKLSFENFFV